MKYSWKMLGTSLAMVCMAVTVSVIAAQTIPSASAATADFYLKIDGIDSTISIDSFSWGVSTGEQASGIATGRRQYQPLVIQKDIDRTSPVLFHDADAGQTFKTVTLTEQGAGGTTFNVTLSNATISSFTEQSGSGASPTETIKFSFQKITMQ